MSSAVVEKLLRERPDGWFRDYDTMLLRALVDAMEEGRNRYGDDVKHWRYGNSLTVGINNPVFHRVPWVGKYFDIAPVAMSGSGTTVKQATVKLAPSMRMNADLGDWDRSLLNIQTGQSGQILSSHYRDEWEDYLAGRSYAMQFGTVKAASTLVLKPSAISH
jgi:penicillin amidase